MALEGSSMAAANCDARVLPDMPSLLAKHTLLKNALPPAARNIVDSDLFLAPDQPFDSDESFLRFLVAKIACVARAHDVAGLVSQTVVDPRHSLQISYEEMLAHQQGMRRALEDVVAVLEETQKQKLKCVTSETQRNGKPLLLPRFVRLTQRLELSNKEVRLFESVVVQQCASDSLRAHDCYRSDRMEFSVYAGMTPLELLQFASKSRLHMKQGIFTDVSLAMSDGERRLDDELDFARHSHNHAVLNSEVAKALVGGQLTQSEMLKLDEAGALAATLREEGDGSFLIASEGSNSAANSSSSGMKPAKEAADETKNNNGASLVGVGCKREAEPEAKQLNESKRARPESEAESRIPAALLHVLGNSLGPTVDVAVGDASLQKPMAVDAVPSDDDLSGCEAAGDDVLSSLLLAERRRDQRRKKVVGDQGNEVIAASAEGEATDDIHLHAYTTDLEYLVDAVELVARKGRLYRVKQKIENNRGTSAGEDGQNEDEQAPFLPPWERRREDPNKDRRRVRELEGQIKQLSRQIEERMRRTKDAAADHPKGIGWVPRLERILSSRQMNVFEKEVVTLLVGLVLLPSKLQHIGGGGGGGGGYIFRSSKSMGIMVNDLLSALSPDLAGQISNRKSFYKDAVLVRDNMVHVGSNGMRGDLTSCPVEIDRRMVDFIVGLDSEVHQLVDGSHLYYPQQKMDSVVLPEESKNLIVKTVKSFALYRKTKKTYNLDDTISATGLVMLFYGDSGTGKTMTANAVANMLGKKLLLINFPSLGGAEAADVVRVIFRESKINDAVLFFDECESIFESREKSHRRDVNMLLTELERHDGLIILATNRPFDLDEAMHRRITLAIEFHKPDHMLRKNIWKALLPPALPLKDEVDLGALAMRYELSGGFIKNAILTALSIACSRAEEERTGDESLKITVSHDDLARGAQMQLRGRLAMRSFDRRIIPKSGLDSLVCGDSLLKRLQSVVDFEKSKTVLYSQWGFGGTTAFSGGQPEIGSCVLFYGPPGTGKSLSAQAIGFEVGRPLKVVNSANVVDKYVGETGKNIEKIFVEARAMEAILVFDEAEGLFGRRSTDASSSVDKHSNLDGGLLLYWLEHYPGLCILTTNTKDAIDSAFFRRFRFMIEFPAPDRSARARLWQACIPKQAPRSSDVDFNALASEFEKFSGGDIQNVVIRAASTAALRSPEDKRQICMADLRKAAREEGSKLENESILRLYS